MLDEADGRPAYLLLHYRRARAGEKNALMVGIGKSRKGGFSYWAQRTHISVKPVADTRSHLIPEMTLESKFFSPCSRRLNALPGKCSLPVHAGFFLASISRFTVGKECRSVWGKKSADIYSSMKLRETDSST